jgi:hypothetical protein
MERLAKPRCTVVVAVTMAAMALAGAAAMAISAGAALPAGDESSQVLRLPDLPRGYLGVELREEAGTAPLCTPLTEPEDTPPRMLRFIHRYHPEGCIAAYGRLFTPPGEAPGPEYVGTGVLAAHSDREAGAAWAVLPEMLGRLNGDRIPVEATAPVRIGAATRVFHTRLRVGSGRVRNKLASFLAWRSGTTLATVLVTGSSYAADDRIAAEYAKRQQVHIASPTPYTEAELFDGDVPLDNPALDLPVYWLGRNFLPGAGLPSNRLFDSGLVGKAIPEKHEDGFAEGPQPPLYVRYENIRLDTWTPADWHVYAGSATGRAITAWKCTQTREVSIPGGTATVFGGYKRDFKRCPKQAPRAFTAWVHVGGVIVVVNAPFAADSIELVNPYSSFAGMEAIVGALQLRPAPTY